MGCSLPPRCVIIPTVNDTKGFKRKQMKSLRKILPPLLCAMVLWASAPALADGAGDAGKSTGEGLREVGREVKEGAKVVGHGFKEFGKDVWQGMKSFGKGFKEGVSGDGGSGNSSSDKDPQEFEDE